MLVDYLIQLLTANPKSLLLLKGSAMDVLVSIVRYGKDYLVLTKGERIVWLREDCSRFCFANGQDVVDLVACFATFSIILHHFPRF